ncbi:MAG: hypothetical protein JO157_11935 [Acetobacteraceae bacterium]|nr:hypothetical protein [Acetobacteraceae bacterium]
MATRTFTHLYDNHDYALQTVQALESAGVPHSDISLVANNADNRYGATTATGAVPADDTAAESTGAGTGASVGTILGGGAGLLAGLGMLAIPGVGPVVAAGWLVATLTGAGVGAAGGGLLGSLVGAGVPEEHAHTYAESVRRGSTLVTVRGDDGQASRIEAVLNGRAPAAVDVTTRRMDYQTEGWTQHETTAPAYTAAQVTAERSRRVRVS